MRKLILTILLILALLGVGVSAASSGQIYLPIVNNLPTTPPPTPPKPETVVVLPNFSWRTMDGYLIITGEVENNTKENADFIEITIDIFNAHGQLIDAQSAYTYLNNALASGDKTFFVLSLVEPLAWSYFEIEAPTYEAGGESAPNLTIENDGSTWDLASGKYYIWAEITNNDVDDVDYAHAIITIYNSEGTVINGAYVPLDEEYLVPYQKSGFMTFFDDQDYTGATYRLQADGWRRQP